MTLKKNLAIKIGLALVSIVTGCNNVTYSPKQEAQFVKPTVAVMSFENLAPVHMKWNLGDALADQLIDRLLNTKRYVVLERAQLNTVLRELKRSQDSRFRVFGQPQQGQLKHVRYLVKGTITDFGHIETVEGIWKLFDWGLFGSSSKAIVAANLYVVDIQSGQIIASKSVEAQIRDKKEPEEQVQYQGMAFGSYTFYHTPLGRATNKMLDEAVAEIAKSIAEQPFQPKIASILNDVVVINGGRDRMIKEGYEYDVRPEAQIVLDPDSGDILGHIAGETIGRLRVSQVTQKYSIAEVMEGGQFEPGHTLFMCDPTKALEPVKQSIY